MSHEKNRQGFYIIGMDFAKNYNKKIHGCFVFDFMGHELSVSTGACNSSTDSYPTMLSEILVTNKKTNEEFLVAGSVEDAIKKVIELSK